MNNKNTPILIVAIVLIAGIAGLIAYGIGQTKDNNTQTSADHHPESSQASPTAKVDAKKTDKVEISGFAYSPAAIKIAVGTKVTWTNKDSVEHNIVGDDFEDLNGPLLKQDETFSYTFKKAGTYAYHCNPHPYMKGTVIVTD